MWEKQQLIRRRPADHQQGKLAQRAYRQRQIDLIEILQKEVIHLKQSLCDIINASHRSHDELLDAIKQAQQEVSLAVREVSSEASGPLDPYRDGMGVPGYVDTHQRAFTAPPVGMISPETTFDSAEVTFAASSDRAFMTPERSFGTPESDIDQLLSPEYAPLPSIEHGSPHGEMPITPYMVYDPHALQGGVNFETFVCLSVRCVRFDSNTQAALTLILAPRCIPHKHPHKHKQPPSTP